MQELPTYCIMLIAYWGEIQIKVKINFNYYNKE